VVLDGDGTGDLRADGDALFLLMRTAVAAYRIPDGARRWSVPVSPGARLLTAARGRVVRSPAVHRQRRADHGGGPRHRRGAVAVLGRTEHRPAPPRCLVTAGLVACHRERVSVWLR
jgi:hypothetical protein